MDDLLRRLLDMYILEAHQLRVCKFNVTYASSSSTIKVFPYLHVFLHKWKLSLREKRPNTEFFWSVFSRIRTEYAERRSISPYSVKCWKIQARKSSVFGHFSRGVCIGRNKKNKFKTASKYCKFFNQRDPSTIAWWYWRITDGSLWLNIT